MATNGAPAPVQAGTGDAPSTLTTATPNSPAETFDDPEADVPSRKLQGRTATLATVLAVGLSCYALYWVIGIVQPQIYRVSFLLITLVLTFLVFPALPRWRERVTWTDWALAAVSVAALAWPIIDFEQFVYRAATPTGLDLALGTVTTLLVLEATRRTVGPILPVTAVAFLLYGYYGPFLELVGLELFAHRGYDVARLVGTLYMTLEGIFGVPLNVCATFIILFTIFGSVLGHSGAGQFFITWTMSAFGRSQSGAGPGRTVTLSGFLLGTVSGSGVATTVTLGAVVWPMLRRAGFSAEIGGGILSASGIGAIMAPPMMGAAAFLIAEFLQITYLQVIVMAIIPAILYYLSIVLMIEADARRLGTRAVDVDVPSVGELTRRGGYQFLPLISIIALLVTGMTPFRAVFLSTLLAVGLSFLRKENALRPRRLVAALEAGGRGVLSVAATTATAGIIVGVVTLTGLGLKLSGIIVSLAGGNIFLTVVYAAVAVWMLGLAVPVTASYIIAAVMIAPALTLVGVPDFAAHMFIFYYAVLSEVSPPTALSPFAAAAITGGNPFRTMMLTWKYTLPAFLVPFAFTVSPEGAGVLLQAPAADVVRTVGTAVVGVSALAMGLGGWLRQATTPVERLLAVAGGLLLFYATAATDIMGVLLFGAAIALHLVRTR
ncbi:MAG: TRAP transporter fused permease subunit [Acidobacteria bacterium]|nr:TRAP transporter fused permease subunit [Acidobacteriota bacterium]